MAIGTLTQKLRPVRIAFLVDPVNKESVQEAIKMNSLLWGGTLNPIVPCYKRLPKTWDSFKSKNETALSVIKGYIEGFDPDYFVNLSKYEPESINIDQARIIKQESFWAGFRDDFAPTVGVGIFEVLDQFIHEELRFTRTFPIELIKPKFQIPYGLFLSSVYGDLGELSEDFYDHWLRDLNAKEKAISIKNFFEFANSKYMFPRSLVTQYLEQRIRGPFLFYMDASSVLDIIDFWNLRAAGFGVFPFPKQAEHEKPINKLASSIIREAYVPDRYNRDLYDRATFIKSRATTESEVKRFSNKLKIDRTKDGKMPEFSYQHWYPRIWDDWARKNTRETVFAAYSAEKDTELLDGQNEFRVKVLDPKFDLYYTTSGEPRFVNEIDSRVYGHDELLAQAIPVGGSRVADVVGKFSIRDWRISKTGPVYLSRHEGWSINFMPPLAEQVMKAWFSEQGWHVELSPSGKIAKQMIKQLGGVWGISKLQHKSLIDLFRDLNNKGFISETDFKGRIARIVNQDDVFISRDRFIKNLLDQNIFQLGVQIICPTCTQKTWYSLSAVSSEVQCDSCLNYYKIQSVGLDDKQWAYRATGTFGLPKQAYGAFSVLLTLLAFSRDPHEKVTPLLSFDAKKGNKNLEADLCLFIEEGFKDDPKKELLFAECKTYNHFDKNDIDRMMALAAEFPGSALVLATMRTHLTSAERRIIKPLVNIGRRRWRSKQNYNPVIVLTGTELFSNEGIPYCWRDKEGKAGEIAKGHFYPRTLANIADATQQIYLGMQPYHEWRKEQWQKRQTIR